MNSRPTLPVAAAAEPDAVREGASPGPLARRIAADLRMAVGRLKRRLREQALANEQTPSQVAVLDRLERDGPASITALAQAEGVRSQSMGATVASLQALEFVAGSPHPSDGRQTLWVLTEHYRRWIAERRAAREDWLARAVEAQLQPDEQQRLAEALALLDRLAND